MIVMVYAAPAAAGFVFSTNWHDPHRQPRLSSRVFGHLLPACWADATSACKPLLTSSYEAKVTIYNCRIRAWRATECSSRRELIR